MRQPSQTSAERSCVIEARGIITVRGKMECSGAEAAEAKIVRRGDGHVVTNVKGRALAPRSPLARLRLPAHGLSCAEQKGVLHTQSCIAPTHTHTYKRTHRQAHKHETHTHTRKAATTAVLFLWSSKRRKKNCGILTLLFRLRTNNTVDSSTLAFSLSSHRPSFRSLLFSSRFLDA
jgi:hypothetical protein